MSQVALSAIKSGDYVRRANGEVVKVLASYKDGYGPSAVWCVEGYAEGRPTAHLRGNPDLLVERVRGQ